MYKTKLHYVIFSPLVPKLGLLYFLEQVMAFNDMQ